MKTTTLLTLVTVAVFGLITTEQVRAISLALDSSDTQINQSPNRAAKEMPTVDDDWLKFKIEAALAFHTSTSLDTAVNVNHGVVTVTGSANSLAQKDLTTEYVRDVLGVKSVINNMHVPNQPTKSTTAPGWISSRTIGERIDDAAITFQAKAKLLMQESTNGLHTIITTRDGVVTVTGNAKTPEQKDLVTELIKKIPDVKKVHNEIKVGG